MIRLGIVFMFLGSSPALADSIVAARTIPAQTVLTLEDLALVDIDVSNGIEDPFALVGKESRVALFQGRPIRQSDVVSPAIVSRNEIITLIYAVGGLSIKTEGRALDRGGAGDLISVMNLGSRKTVVAQIGADGAAYVGALQ